MTLPTLRRATIKTKRKLGTWIGALVEGSIAPACDEAFANPPIFIIGPPRSGSTLLMQTLTDAFDAGYLSNAHCRWYSAPAIAERAFRPLKMKQPSDFRSEYGRTTSSYAPAECGPWWYRFFPSDPAYVTREQANPAKMKAFRRSLLSLDRAFGKPVFFKNLYAVLRLGPILQHVPEAVFIVVERDKYANALSILKGRMDAFGVYDRWWSVPVPDRQEDVGAVEQVAAQIDSIYALIDRHLGGSTRVHRISYEEFCGDSARVLARLAEFAGRLDIDLAPRFSVPQSFPMRMSATIPPEMDDELRRWAGVSPQQTDVKRGNS